MFAFDSSVVNIQSSEFTASTINVKGIYKRKKDIFNLLLDDEERKNNTE